MSINRLPELNQAPSWGNVRGLPAGTIDIVATGLLTLRTTDTAFPQLISVREAAIRLHVHENTIRNWVDRGVLRAVRLPGSKFRRLPVSEVDRVRRGILGALASGRQGPAHELPPGRIDYLDTDERDD